jgi:hypothetical protein
MKGSSDNIGNRSRDLPSVVPQLLRHRVPRNEYRNNSKRICEISFSHSGVVGDPYIVRCIVMSLGWRFFNFPKERSTLFFKTWILKRYACILVWFRTWVN